MTLCRLSSTGALNPVLVTLPFWKAWPDKFKSVYNYERRKRASIIYFLFIITLSIFICIFLRYRKTNKSKIRSSRPRSRFRNRLRQKDKLGQRQPNSDHHLPLQEEAAQREKPKTGKRKYQSHLPLGSLRKYIIFKKKIACYLNYFFFLK